MSLDKIKAAGGFITAEPVAKEITWVHIDQNGEEQTDTFTVYVKRQSFGEVEQMFVKPEGEEYRALAAQYISRSLLFGDNKDETMSYEEAFRLDPALGRLFVNAINDVNKKERAPKN